MFQNINYDILENCGQWVKFLVLSALGINYHLYVPSKQIKYFSKKELVGRPGGMVEVDKEVIVVDVHG